MRIKKALLFCSKRKERKMKPIDKLKLSLLLQSDFRSAQFFAAELGLSDRTIRNYMTQIKEELRAH
jgi:transcriptional antiterminator